MQFDPPPYAVPPGDPAPLERSALRSKLRAGREAFVRGPAFAQAHTALSAHLVKVLGQLEPQCLGLYWPIRSEFNAVPACASDPLLATLPWALPFTRRLERQMEFRRWDGRPPTLRDESGLLSADGAPVVPDVLLLPCLGYTIGGFRLGYGAGYFDRWLATHPACTAVGLAWSVGLLTPEQFRPESHDQRLMLVLTEQGVVGG